ncbi:MAG: hypothetical protein HGA39_09610 [Coriobacteriia bacterium]|nr:hypothetical protein [Coriobacteriia bacterium]
MDFVQVIVGMLTNTMGTLQLLIEQYGSLAYTLIFVIIFCETGLVVMPFLPGDSLLFAAGALAGVGLLDPWIVIVVVVCGAVLGDNTNYFIGRTIGKRLLCSSQGHKILRPEYVERTEAFFIKHGGKTVTLARFFPIIRTYAPFMAGVGQMRWPRFVAYSAGGSVAWASIYVAAGILLGQVPFIRDNFEVMVISVIVISLAPAVYHALKPRFAKRSQASSDEPAE